MTTSIASALPSSLDYHAMLPWRYCSKSHSHAVHLHEKCLRLFQPLLQFVLHQRSPTNQINLRQSEHVPRYRPVRLEIPLSFRNCSTVAARREGLEHPPHRDNRSLQHLGDCRLSHAGSCITVSSNCQVGYARLRVPRLTISNGDIRLGDQ